MSELPKGWATATLPEVAKINPIIGKSSYSDDLEVSFVPMPAVEAETGKIDVSQIRKFGDVKKGYTPFLQQDVLFAKITPCMENGKMAVVPALHNNIGFGSTEFHVLRSYEGIEPRYLYYFVSSKAYRYDAEHNMTGAVGQKRVPTPYIEKSVIPLPPLNEQKRIVAKIEELFSELDKGIESLKTARAQLKVYRQAILKHAFEGKLTSDWREKNKDKLECADKLLKRTPAHRSKKLNALTQEELEKFPELPSGWTYTRLGHFIENISAGKSFKCDEREPTHDEIGVAKVSAVTWGKYDEHESKTCLDADKINPEYFIKSGDFLFSRANTIELVGACVIAKNVSKRVMLSDKTLRIVFNDIDLFYFLYYLRSQMGRNKIMERSTGNQESMRNIGQDRIRNIIAPVCSPQEAIQVAYEIQEKFSIIENLEATIDSELQKSEALRQSILKKAFSGRLVSQDPADEPASVLLERIRAQKEGQTAKKKPKEKRRAA